MRRQGFQLIKLLASKVQIPVVSQCRSMSQLNRETKNNYSVKEYNIEGPDSLIAGKLWQGNEARDSKSPKETPILAIHGWLDNANTFDPLLNLVMKPNRTVYAMDLPGHGRSPLGPRVYFETTGESLLSINRVMTHFNWDEVILLGHSMGSIISFNFAGVFPEYVKAYIGLDVIRAIPRDHITSVRKIAYAVVNIEKKLASKKEPPSYSYDEILQRTYKGRKSSVSIEGCKILLERGAIALPNNKYRFSHDLRVTVPASIPISAEVSRQIGQNIKCPICMIKGDPGEYYEPREDFHEFIKFMQDKLGPLFEYHEVPGTHHFHLNTPELTANIVSEFLDVRLPSLVLKKEK